MPYTPTGEPASTTYGGQLEHESYPGLWISVGLLVSDSPWTNADKDAVFQALVDFFDSSTGPFTLSSAGRSSQQSYFATPTEAP